MKKYFALIAAAAVIMAVGLLPALARTADAAGVTGTVAVCLTDSTGANVVLGGDQAWYQVDGGSTNYVGAVGPSGCREQTVTGTNVAVWVGTYPTRSQHETVPVPNGTTTRVDFYTTKVTLQYSAGLAFGGPTGDSVWFNKPSMELVSDGVTPVHFRLDGTGGPSGRMTLLWPSATGTGAQYEATLAVARVIDSGGSPLPGATIAGYASGWFDVPGATNADGILAFSHDGLHAITSVAATYNGTRQQIDQNSLTNSVYHFQTLAVAVQLKDSNLGPLDGGSVSYYASGWHAAGTTTGGQVAIQMLPGTYSFAMVYNNSRQQVDYVNVTSTNPVVFQTGSVTIHYSGSATWYYGGYFSFTGPQELLPGTIYGLLDSCHVPIVVASGDHLNLSGILARLYDSSNAPQSGGVATAYVGGWQNVGTTDNSGRACALFNGTLGNTSVAMVYNGSRQQITQNQPTNSVYAFHAVGVVVQLKNSGGALADTGTASYYASGWHAIGDTLGGQVSVDLLPGSYSFAMTYNGTRQQMNSVNITTMNPVVFQTVAVVLQLKNSSGTLTDPGTASYYASGWHTIGDTSGGQASVEMLPGSYSFAMTYNGTRQQMNSMDITSVNPVIFQTVDVAVQLKDHLGNALDTGSASYYASGWHTIGDTSVGQVSVELLPGSYSFAMTYDGTREQMNSVNITTTNPVVFQTGQVVSGSGNATGYYASGWKPFTSGDELLPGTYTFKFSDQANSSESITGGIVNSIH